MGSVGCINKVQTVHRFSQSTKKYERYEKQEEKIAMVRDSGKSISASTANPFSITGSGNRFYSHHNSEAVSDEFNSSNIVRKYERNSTSGINKRRPSANYQENERSLFSR